MEHLRQEVSMRNAGDVALKLSVHYPDVRQKYHGSRTKVVQKHVANTCTYNRNDATVRSVPTPTSSQE